MALLIRNEVLLAKIESTYNTDPVPDGTDAFAFSGVSWSNEGLRMNDRERVTQGIDTDQRIYGGSLKSITASVELKGSGTAGTAPEYGVLLRACGLGETIVAVTSVTYAPVSTGHESCTIYYFEQGVRHKLTGCRGTANFTVTAGGIPMAEFVMTGHTQNPTDTAAPTPTYDATVPAAVVGVPFTWGGTSIVINEFTASLNNQIATAPSVSASDGYGDVQITARDVGGSIDPESVLVATDAVLADFVAGTTAAVSIGAIGATAGNILDVDLPVAYYVDTAPGDREGIRTKQLSYAAATSAGDDEISLAFT